MAFLKYVQAVYEIVEILTQVIKGLLGKTKINECLSDSGKWKVNHTNFIIGVRNNLLIYHGKFNRTVGFQKQFNKGNNDKLQSRKYMRCICHND